MRHVPGLVDELVSVFPVLDIPGLVDELVSVFPVLEERGILRVPLPNVHVVENARKKVVNLTRYVQDVLHTAKTKIVSNKKLFL